MGSARPPSGPDRENDEGAVAVAVRRRCGRPRRAEVRERLRGQVPSVRRARSTTGPGRGDRRRRRPSTRHKDAIDDLRLTLKENIEVGQVVRFAAEPGHVLDTYLHVQNGRGVNGVLVELPDGGTAELAHDIAVHIAFGRPSYLHRDDVPADEVAAERAALEAQTRNEGKPEQALPKIVEGKLNGWYKRVPGGVLLEQPYAKDDKQTCRAGAGRRPTSSGSPRPSVGA